MKTYLVRCPDDEAPPAGAIAQYAVRGPRRYAVVEDPAAWTAWVAARFPEHLPACGHVDRAFEAQIRKVAAQLGGWRDPAEVNGPAHAVWRPLGVEGPAELVPGMVVRDDGQARIVGYPFESAVGPWESPLDWPLAGAR